MREKYVKENIVEVAPVSPAMLLGALLASAAALAAVALIDVALPEPLRRGAPEDSFIAEIAHEHLVNLTSIGPRVAGSYENEVAAVGVLVEGIKAIARAASPHNHVELDLQRASGNFSLSFFDGMNNVYRDVQSVVARVRGAGGRASRSQLLLNCHYDTVPDSPGASDDGAGCAVLLETMRALAASPRPLRHDAVFLLNGAEENIMQGSHAFVTQHRWAKAVRVFINIEACGAGGREVLFQAGPHDPWIMEVYAGAVPHPFASSLAQELFESGLIPADTDFRIFRDFGRLSGVDLAWSSNGYVYHTALDTADRVPPSALQRTGDNVLALTHGLLSSENLDSAVDWGSRQPVFFDVLGLFVVSARAPAALLAAALTLAAVALRLHCSARDARAQLYVRYGSWWVGAWRACGRVLAAFAAGVLAAAAAGLALHATGARLSFYSRPWLLAPLYAAPAIAAAWSVVRGAGPRGVRRIWAARMYSDALCLVWGALLLALAALRLRSGFVPLLWALLPAPTALSPPSREGAWLAAWCACCALPALQTCYLALGSLAMFVPIMGRAGAPPVPPDVLMGVVVAGLVLAACSWTLPLVAAARGVNKLVWALVGSSALALLLALSPLGAPYSDQRPQRYMLFHVRRSERAFGDSADTTRHLYWLPRLDVNTPRAVADYVPSMRSARATTAASCARWVYCGAPYFLPVIRFLPHALDLPAPPHDHLVTAHTALDTTRRRLAPRTHLVQLNVTGPSHLVVIASPVAGGRVVWSSVLERPREAAPWGPRRTYFYTLHTARVPRERPWNLSLRIQIDEDVADVSDDQPLVQLSVAGHDMSGPRAKAHDDLLRSFPPFAAPTGWPVDMHLRDV